MYSSKTASLKMEIRDLNDMMINKVNQHVIDDIDKK